MTNSNHTIETILDAFKHQIGEDFDIYRNHVYRVFSYCIKMDTDRENYEKYAITAAFHDLGIWSDKTFDYLDPSIRKAQTYLKNLGKKAWVNEISLMIDNHHKMSSYKGAHHKTVEIFRRADWIDVSKGKLRFNLTKADILEAENNFPAEGFHKFLLRETVNHFKKRPYDPLPMFKF